MCRGLLPGDSLETCPFQGSNGGFVRECWCPCMRNKPIIPSPAQPRPPGTDHQLQSLVEEPVAFAVQVGIGAACLGHTDPGKAGLL